jgi:hypothetical protein
MKYIYTLLLTASLAHSATIISSTVTHVGDVFRYTYRAQSQVGKHDISNITIPVCDAFDEFGDDRFTLDRKPTTLKFDSIRPDGPEFVFGFSSNHAPVEGPVAIKAGRETYYAPAYHPPTCVPEPSALMFCAVFFAVALTIRRR